MNPGILSTELVLMAGGFLLLLLQAFAPRLKPLFAPAAILTFLGALAALTLKPSGLHLWGTWEVNGLTRFFTVFFLLGGALAVFFGAYVLRRDGMERGEHYALLLWGTVGMLLMVSTRHLLLIFVGLELLSVVLYLLVATYRRTEVAVEAALKYFLLGSFASAVTLFGMAWYFGMAGHLMLAPPPPPLPKLMGMAYVLLCAGFAFKMALVPFHAWAPDVYQGSPSSVTPWLATLPKMAALVVLVRILQTLPPPLFLGILAAAAVVTMFTGNLLAFVQQDTKRMLAWSGVAHMGYILIGLAAATPEATKSVFVYAVAYALTTLTAFAVLGALTRGEHEPHFISDLAGAGFRHPVPALVLTLCMASLAGIPPLVGFAGKFYLFYAAVEAGRTGLAVLGILNTILSLYFYIRVIYTLYMKPAPVEPLPDTTGGPYRVGLGLAGLLIVFLGLAPAPLFEAASRAFDAMVTYYVR
jgi:NADH-quinone oxidoreductase subunit N